jgi:hypothetical protein
MSRFTLPFALNLTGGLAALNPPSRISRNCNGSGSL